MYSPSNKRARLSLCDDRVFRGVFSKKEAAPYLLSLLNAVMKQFGFPLLRSAEVRNPILSSPDVEQKTPVLDLLVEDDLGRSLDIEMQTCVKPNLSRRALYYAARGFADSLHKGDDYGKLRPNFTIMFVRFPIPDRPNDWLTDVRRMTSSDDPAYYSNDIVNIFIRLPDNDGPFPTSAMVQELSDWTTFMSLVGERSEEVEEIVERDPLLAELSKQLSPYLIGKESTMWLTWEDIRQMEKEEDEKYWEETIEGLKKEKRELARKAQEEKRELARKAQEEKRELERKAQEEKRELERKAQEEEFNRRRETIDCLDGLLSTKFPNDYENRAEYINERLTRREHKDLVALLARSALCDSFDSFMALL